MSQGLTPDALATRKIFTSHIALIASIVWSLLDFVFTQLCGNAVNTQSIVMNPQNYVLWFASAVDWLQRHKQGTTDPTKTRTVFTTHIAITGSVVWSGASLVLGQLCGHSIDVHSVVMNSQNYVLWFAAAVDWIKRHWVSK